MAYAITWDETKPDDNNYGYEIDNYIRNVLAAVRERLTTEHTDVSGSGGLATMMHKWTVTAKSSGSPYTALITDHVLLITTGASDYTINLFTAVGNSGKILKIKKVDSGVGTVIIDASSTQTIDGALTYVLSKQYQFVYIVSDGSNWHVVGTDSHFDWDNVWADAVHTHASDAEGGALSYSTLKFLAATTNKINWSAATDWTDVDISANTGSDTAKAALIAVDLSFIPAFGDNSAMTGLCRKNGSAETAVLPRIRTSGRGIQAGGNFYSTACMMIVECDGSEIFETKLSLDGGGFSTPGSIVYKVDLIGYFI